MKTINLDFFLTIQQAAIESKKSESLLRKRIQDNKLKHLKVGHSLLIPKEEVEKLKEEAGK